MNEEIKEGSLKNQRELYVKKLEKQNFEHTKYVENLNAEWAEKLANCQAECAENTAKLIEKHEKQLEIERKKRSPKRITFDWKFSQIAKWFVSICAFATISFAGNIKQYRTIEHQKQLIEKLKPYATAVRFLKADSHNVFTTIDLILQEFQTPDDTELKRFINGKILEYETGERLMKKR